MLNDWPGKCLFYNSLISRYYASCIMSWHFRIFIGLSMCSIWACIEIFQIIIIQDDLHTNIRTNTHVQLPFTMVLGFESVSFTFLVSSLTLSIEHWYVKMRHNIILGNFRCNCWFHFGNWIAFGFQFNLNSEYWWYSLWLRILYHISRLTPAHLIHISQSNMLIRHFGRAWSLMYRNWSIEHGAWHIMNEWNGFNMK